MDNGVELKKESFTPANFYRKMIRYVFKMSHQNDDVHFENVDDSSLQRYFFDEYQLAKQRLLLVEQNSLDRETRTITTLVEKGMTKEHAIEMAISGIRYDIYELAVGLFIFGHLEVVDDILINIPQTSGRITELANSVRDLLPIPQRWNVIKDREIITGWINTNKHKLYWNNDELCYKLTM